MFSSDDLIHLVFADESDTYYCDNLLKLDLHQFLWFKLHEKYSSVYFLTLSENTFSIKTYGDLKCKEYRPAHKFLKRMGFGSAESELGTWIREQLTSKRNEPAAFVCSLEDLCKVSEYRDWINTLKIIAREKGRTGILVLTVPVSAERSKDLFLRDPVFEHLQEDAVLDVRAGALRDLYGSIKRGKGESCVFLNTFSRDRVYSILLHVVLEQKGRFLSQKDMETVTEYLVEYLASMELQRDYPLFNSQIPGPYMQFRNLYNQLRDETVWKRLLGRCLKKKRSADDPAESTESAMEFHMIRDRSCYAGKCMLLQIPHRIKQLDTEADRAADTLLAIQRELLRPKNRAENDMLSARAADFLKKLAGVSHDDLGTYKRILEAIHFCVTWVYIQEQSEEEQQASKIVEFLDGYINISAQCYQIRKNVELAKQKSASGILTGISIQQAQDKLAASEKALRKYQDLVDASIMNLFITSFSDHIVEEMEELKQGLEKYHPVQGGASQDGLTEGGDLSGPSSGGDRPKDDTGLYLLDDIDYRPTPPI